MKMTLTPPPSSSATTLEQPVRLGDGQARRRLVHDDDLGVERQRLGDLDELALGEREIGDGRVGLEIGAEPVEQRPACGAQVAAVDEPGTAAQKRLAAEEDVGGDVEIVEEVELLVNEGDAGGDGLRDGEMRRSPPAIRIVPRARLVTPPRIFISVLLPAPFSPIEPDDLAAARRQG